jgi:hypothetical protein
MSEKDNSNLDEFFDKVGSEKKPIKAIRVKYRNDEALPSAQSTEDKEEKKPGKLVQYAHFMTGFMATSHTIRTLPAGCYKPQASQAGFWFDPVNLVTDKLIPFPDTKSDLVISEIEQFWGLKNKFRKFGFSHKRGYLLWGPPGSGKTCTVAMIIKKMVNKNGLVIIADHPKLLSESLAQLRSVEPDRELVVIWEDIDAVIERYGESEVLAVLDGESQVDNVVFIATTNYPEKLDARITNRPSRFDRIEKIDMPSAEAREVYLKAKGCKTIIEGVDLVAETQGLSIAHLREVIVGIWCLGNSPQEVLTRLKKMKVKPNSASAGQSIGITSVN